MITVYTVEKYFKLKDYIIIINNYVIKMTKIFFNKIRNYKQKKCYIKNLQVVIDSYNNSQYHYIKSWIIKINIVNIY